MAWLGFKLGSTRKEMYITGDSGGPGWDPRTMASIGLNSAQARNNASFLQPLLTTYAPDGTKYVGARNAAVMANLSIAES